MPFFRPYEARQFGADQFVNTSAEGALAAAANSCDLLLSTVTADLPWAEYVNVLRPDGKLCLVGVPDADVKISALQMILGQKSLLTSIIGSRSEIRTMLDFSARHQIKPQIEIFPLADVNSALRRIADNTVRYSLPGCIDDGLKNFQKGASEGDRIVNVCSKLGQGTTVEMRIPMLGTTHIGDCGNVVNTGTLRKEIKITQKKSLNLSPNLLYMNRPTFLLIAGIYSTLLAISMVFVPEMSLKNYGVPSVDVSHIAVMQFLGLSVGGFAILLLLNRNAPSSSTLRSLLLAEATNALAGVVLGIYHVYGLHVPISTFFIGDTVFRLVIGLGFVYFYSREANQPVVV